MATWKRLLTRCLLLLTAVYLGVLLVLMYFETSLVYRPVTVVQDWQQAPHADIIDVELTSKGGTPLHAWWCARPESNGAVLYLHGNAGNLSHRGGSILKLRELLKMSVLIVDYPGYGKSRGRPSEAGCYAAGQAGYDWLVEQQKVQPDEILFYGISLGGGVAVELATRQPCRGVVLVKAFTSAPDVGQYLYPWLPIRWVMRTRFDNIAKLPDVRVPVFISHGTDDSLIPFSHGERLYAAAKEPKRFLAVPGGHNDPLPPEFFEELNAFLAQSGARVKVTR